MTYHGPKLTPESEKRCSKCGKTKLAKDFRVSKKLKCGYGSWCKECYRTYYTYYTYNTAAAKCARLTLRMDKLHDLVETKIRAEMDIAALEQEMRDELKGAAGTAAEKSAQQSELAIDKAEPDGV